MCRCVLAVRIPHGGDAHQAASRTGRRAGATRSAAAGNLAQPGPGHVGAGGGDSCLVAGSHQSPVDLPNRLVAPVTTASSSPLDEILPPLAVLLLGPTGSGKTALSLALGERFGGEIVSCDSVAVYRGMELGTAKPTIEERARLPHHLIDVADPDQPFTAGEYSRQARTALSEIASRNRLPIVTGGTGLYLRALTEGLFAGPERQTALRARLQRSRQRRGEAWLHRLLQRLDPASAERIHANDAAKLMRAIEVCMALRKPLSKVLGDREKARDPLTGFRFLRIGLNPPRQTLYDR